MPSQRVKARPITRVAQEVLFTRVPTMMALVTLCCLALTASFLIAPKAVPVSPVVQGRSQLQPVRSQTAEPTPSVLQSAVKYLMHLARSRP